MKPLVSPQMHHPPTSSQRSHLRLPAEICRDVHTAIEREWIVTNGIGGYAFGTLSGALTRRYHGLLIAALNPPLGRTLLLTKLDDTLETPNLTAPLFTNIWSSGIEYPNGCAAIESFELMAGVPTWRFAVVGARLTKRIWMEQGANISYVQYVLEQSDGPVTLSLRALAACRDHHHTAPNDERRFDVAQSAGELWICADGAPAGVAIRVESDQAPRGNWTTDHAWFRNFDLPFEATVGYEHCDAHFCAGVYRISMDSKQTVTLVCEARASVEKSMERHGHPSGTPARISSALARRIDRSDQLLRDFNRANPNIKQPVPAAVEQLVIAADQFIVARPTPERSDGNTILAGYPWFTDWGRDTMISLPGLTLSTGRAGIAREILLTWARYVDRGMIPNRFPDVGHTPEYNTVDATLWYLWAIDQYFRATRDVETLRSLYPKMCDIIDWHRRGTRYCIHLADDGLIHAGEPGVQLTWMDAKVGERVITPRIGKPVEINALWYDALCNLAEMSEQLGESRRAAEFSALGERARTGLARFWNPGRSCCFDVIDGPEGDDDRIQANQVFAVCLSHSPLTADQQRTVVATLERTLLTPVGLRTLDPVDPRYCGRYQGRLEQRDEAYHQGTAWGWLLGPFVMAHLRVHRDRAAATRFLAPMFEQSAQRSLGTLAEIFDGDEPHLPRGCVAQAWSVAESLRAWCAAAHCE